jgi:hypothetical protein
MSSFPKNCKAKDPLKCRHHSPFKNSLPQAEKTVKTKKTPELVMSRGVKVIKGKFQSGDFAKGFNTPDSINGYYDGSWEEVEKLVKKHRKDFEPGTGSVDNDVILVNVPAKGFYTAITAIDDDNKHLVEEKDYVRREGEKSVGIKTIKGKKEPAKFVKVVCYRADVLAQDDGRTTDAEWEIVAINAQSDEYTPMHPTTMLRNANHDEGGTLREYSDKDWSDAYSYWDTHAYLEN